MKIVNIKVKDLIMYENNPRNNEPAVDKVANSIKEFGFKVPLVITKDNVICTGHTRKLAAEKLGLEEVPCIIADDLTPEQIKSFRLVDNKTSEFAEWDMELLEKELASLTAFDLDMTKWGFDESVFDDWDLPDTVELPREDIGTSKQLTSLKYGSTNINMTEEENIRFKAYYDNYLSANGNAFGIINELLENGDKNYAD